MKLLGEEIFMSQIYRNTNLQLLREQYIDILEKSENSTESAKSIAENLFALDLTVYSKDYTFDSLIYNAFSQSILDNSISMHPEQVHIIDEINKHDAIIVSAPTSFGKTFCVFEYMARNKPQNIVLIVPTLALVDEYMKRIIKKYTLFFSEYKVHTQLSADSIYDFSQKNIFILTHDRVVQDELYKNISEIDLLVIDEVYKLETDVTDDRVLVLNMAYYYLAQTAKKYVLLAPFIKSVIDLGMLEKEPFFYNTEYSPVVNNVITEEILNRKDRYPQCQKLLQTINSDEKTLVYFPTVTGIYKYVRDFISSEPIIETDNGVKNFIAWAKDEFHEEWSVVKALERGYAIHNGQMPLGIRLYQMNLYEKNDKYNRLLCTSTLLEGVNTSAKNIVITKPARRPEKGSDDVAFSAFDFYNLVGRTGRLNQHFVGDAYYIKSPQDPEYKKIDAIKSVKFEITDSSKDIDIQKGLIEEHDDYKKFLSELGITHEEYLKNIGAHFRFETIKQLFDNYSNRRSAIITELKKLSEEKLYGRGRLVGELYWVCEGKQDLLQSGLLNDLINRNRIKIKTIVDNTVGRFTKKGKNINIDYVISSAINLKTSYIEHQFYGKVNIIKYFMQLEKVSKTYIEQLDSKVLGAIEQLYFSSSKQKKMLMDIGIYERDVDSVISIIGDDFDETFEMKKRLVEKFNVFKNDISYISSYIIRNL